jgi:hypothetical protein
MEKGIYAVGRRIFGKGQVLLTGVKIEDKILLPRAGTIKIGEAWLIEEFRRARRVLPAVLPKHFFSRQNRARELPRNMHGRRPRGKRTGGRGVSVSSRYNVKGFLRIRGVGLVGGGKKTAAKGRIDTLKGSAKAYSQVSTRCSPGHRSVM